jgi:peptide/nickel transport system permease protein
MPTTTARVPFMVVLPRAIQRSLDVVRSAPVIPLFILTLLGFAAIFAPILAPHDKLQPVKPTAEQCLSRFGFAECPYVDGMPPFWYAQGSLNTPLGTDYLGRDILSRLMYGARISLVVGITGTLVAGITGTLLGIVAGYMGTWWDQIIMRITDAWLTLPSLVFAILLSSIRGPGLWNVVLILALVFWSRYTRVVRGEVLSLREREFVKLAEVNGVSKVAIIFRHLLPNVMNTVMVVFSLQVGVSIIIEASLSFLGVGVPPPEPSWGLMMAQERESLMEGKWWLAVFPGICIMLLVLAANLMGDWLRVRLDPQLRNR